MESQSSAAVAAVSESRKKRQKRSIEEKRRIVQDALAPGASIAQTARQHGLNANQVYAWRRLFVAGKLIDKVPKRSSSSTPQLLPVAVREEGQYSVAVAASTSPNSAHLLLADTQRPAGVIHLQFPKAQLRVEGSVDIASLRVVLECLLR